MSSAVVGTVLKAIDESGAADNTLVVFTSDNGCAPYIGVSTLEKKGHFPSGPLRGYKADAWEGGHRVPMIVRWPGKVKKGTVSSQLVHQADLMATCAAIVGAKLPDDAGEDSVSLLPIFGGSDKPVRETAVGQSIRGMSAVRKGNWKMIFGRGSGGWGKGSDKHPAQLYDLASDLGETTNLYAERPELVKELTALMKSIVENGRSTPGTHQKNDVQVNWRRFLQTPKKPPGKRPARAKGT